MDTGIPEDETPPIPIKDETNSKSAKEMRVTTMRPGHRISGTDFVVHADISSRTPPKIGDDNSTTGISKEANSMSPTSQTKLPESGRAW
jgi:hypothetical protein